MNFNPGNDWGVQQIASLSNIGKKYAYNFAPALSTFYAVG
jgi:hypothetical protein